MRKSCTAIWFIWIFVIIGCGQQGESLVVTSGSENIEDTMAVYYASNDRVFLVIWHDLARSLGSGSGHGGSNITFTATETEIKGDYQTSNGNSFEYNCHTSDGKTGSVVIDGAEYDLANV